MRKFFLIFFIAVSVLSLSSQPVTTIKATKNDPLYTTYAAPLSRSEYKTDQGYHFNFSDELSPVEFNSANGPNIGLAFCKGREMRVNLQQFYREPVITSSFSDIMKFYYYPFQDLRTEVLFDVYSSEYSIEEIKLKNESAFPMNITVSPYLWVSSSDTSSIIIHPERNCSYYFFRKNKDGWMKEHNIPLEEELSGVFTGNITFDSLKTFNGKSSERRSGLTALISHRKSKEIFFFKTYIIPPGDSVRFRIISGIEKKDSKFVFADLSSVLKIDPESIIKEDEKSYRNIPRLTDVSSDLDLFYLSCFSLLRQCMMPPEGKCKTNYYVFSREPKWGWGYGGQVFHESLSMLAYAYMDPQGAMNSQRVYMLRQRDDGYINYRTGPYLDETIEYKGASTTSAPWYSYENLEIYRITGDRKFLSEAYESGKRFYNFYVANRDSNNNGLCEWGAEASLESVRDARVAVWDQVGWPSNFEGPDLNSMLVMEAKSLSEMAGILGHGKELQEWKMKANERAVKINRFMWDKETGFYYNVTRDRQDFSYNKPNDLKIKEITGFLPYWAGITDTHQDQQIINTLKNPGQFWRPYGVPSLAADESYYNGIGYWNGPVWVQWDYLVFRGLLEHGDTATARQLAERVINNMTWHLKKDHVFWEFYSPDEREAGWNKTYIWAGIAARFLIDLQLKSSLKK